MLKIEFVDRSIELTFHCLKELEDAGADITYAAKDLTEDGQRVLVFKNKFKKIILERVGDGKYRFILKQDVNMNFTWHSAVFKIRS